MRLAPAGSSGGFARGWTARTICDLFLNYCFAPPLTYDLNCPDRNGHSDR